MSRRVGFLGHGERDLRREVVDFGEIVASLCEG